MRDNGRWHLTDFQRLLVVLIVVISMFLGAMAWGWGRPELALVALFLLVGAGLAIFLLGLRYSSRVLVPGTAEVLSASPPPRRGVVGRCDLELLVDLPGRGRTKVKLRHQVDVTRWPRAGMLLPVQVSGRGQVQVRWQQVDARRVPTAPAFDPAYEPDLEPVPGYNAPFYTDYRDDAFEREFAAGDGGGPTMSGALLDEEPAGPTRPDPGAPPAGDQPFDGEAYFSDLPDPPFAGGTYGDPVYTTGPDPDPYFPPPYSYSPGPYSSGPYPSTSYREQPYPDEPFDIEAYPDEPLTPRQRSGDELAPPVDTTLHTGPDDGPVDVRIYRPDRTDTRLRPVDPEVDPLGADLLMAEEQTRVAGFELPRPGPPLPRRHRRTPAPPAPASDPIVPDAAQTVETTETATAVETAEIVEDAEVIDAAEVIEAAEVVEVAAAGAETGTGTGSVESARSGAGEAISVLLVVSDVDRSVAFYRDKLGFTVEDQTSGGAVLTHGGGPIVLQRLTDMAPVDRRVVLLRLSVPDVEAAYQRLKEQGVEFAQRPGWIRVGRQDVRAAKLHDPDGHAIQLVEGWRRGDGR